VVIICWYAWLEDAGFILEEWGRVDYAFQAARVDSMTILTAFKRVIIDIGNSIAHKRGYKRLQIP